MIYGNSYEGNTRNCEACGHFTNVHSDCTACTKAICEACALNGGCSNDYCSETCKQEVCEHENVRYEYADDCDLSAGYYGFRESWTCRDCGADLEGQSGEVYTERRAA